MTKSSQLAVGFELAEVMISTESPLLRVRDKGTSFPLTRAPRVFSPISVCIEYAKSNADDPCGSDFDLLRGEDKYFFGIEIELKIFNEIHCIGVFSF